jgi:ABC-2 type transport system ATP-binding protein
MGTALLRLAGISRTLGRRLVLDDVSLEVRAGQITGLLGPNGAGKTTLIRIVMGLARPDSGSVETASRIGYLPEERGLYQRQPVDATLTYLARLKGLTQKEAEAGVAAWLDRVEMSEYRGRRVEQLSKGQQQKIQLAAAFVGNPGLLVLDEPFSGLDPLNARLVCDLVREAAAAGCGVLVSAHQLALVDQLCTDLVMLSRGRVVVAGSMEAIHQTNNVSLEDLFMAHAGAGGDQ